MSEPSTPLAQAIQSPWVRRAINAWRLTLAVVLGYRGESVGLRAGNLTFITITSLMPLAAVILALVQTFDAHDRIEYLVLRFFEDVLSPGGKEQSRANIHQFLGATHTRTASGFSFALLSISAGILLRHLDASLNEIWAIRRRRPLLTSLGLYVGVLLIGPLLLGMALLGTDTAKRLLLWANFPFAGLTFAVSGLLVAMVVFATLYKSAPHAHVPWRSAFFGGAIAGLLWELARHLYSSIASFFFSANQLYGALGIAPLFLMWIYVGWYIVLSGARLAYAFEHADFHDEFKDLLAHPRSAELIATRIAASVARAQLQRRAPVTVKSLASALKVPAQRISDLVFQLERAGLLGRQKKELFAARDLTDLTVADVATAVGGIGLSLSQESGSSTGAFDEVARLFRLIDDVSIEKLKEISWLQLAQGGPPSPKP